MDLRGSGHCPAEQGQRVAGLALELPGKGAGVPSGYWPLPSHLLRAISKGGLPPPHPQPPHPDVPS